MLRHNIVCFQQWNCGSLVDVRYGRRDNCFNERDGNLAIIVRVREGAPALFGMHVRVRAFHAHREGTLEVVESCAWVTSVARLAPMGISFGGTIHSALSVIVNKKKIQLSFGDCISCKIKCIYY
ncbi:hypothetical protein CEXT_343791 [Caerostris extrusa]|uniref:Uncharacterized protein n=1 Tax=Caerostris extrusa TaxID=172846 RepID=A0AAV4UUV3_CAEEX|nr:hypothetical protein CEXT_343791 [Caerostris extrusa]